MILSIDPAFSGDTGWAYFDDGKLTDFGKLNAEEAYDTEVRSSMLERASHLVIEDQFMRNNIKVYGMLVESRMWWQGMAKDKFYIDVTVMKPTEWQSKVDSKWKVGSKQNYPAYEKYVRRRWKLPSESIELTKDMIAAISMGSVYLDRQ